MPTIAVPQYVAGDSCRWLYGYRYCIRYSPLQITVTVQRNFPFPEELAERLRLHAFETRRSQAEVVREAVREKLDRVAPVEEDGAELRLRLARRFVAGDGVDLALLRDGDRQIWGLEE